MAGEVEGTGFINAVYPDDLITNRDGNLSERQKLGFQLLIIFWFGIAAVDIAFLVLLGYFQLNYDIGSLGYFLLCILAIMSARYCILTTIPFQKDIRNGEVKVITGKVFKHLSFTPNSSGKLSVGHCTARIGRQVFTLSPYLYDWMLNEDYYRIYFMPNTRRVINIESLF